MGTELRPLFLSTETVDCGLNVFPSKYSGHGKALQLQALHALLDQSSTAP